MNAADAIDLHAIRREHGGTVYDGGRRWVGPGPGHSRQDSSLSVWINTEGRPLVHSFANDDFRDCLKHLGIDASAAAKLNKGAYARMKAERDAEQRARQEAQRKFCAAVWVETQPAAGSPVETYLASRRLELPGSEVLRFHPAAPLDYQARRSSPAMVALLQEAGGTPTGLHITALLDDGSAKRPGNAKLMFGTVKGSCAQLRPFSGGDLAVAEGIETALSFEEMNGVTTWAALSTSGLTNFRLPPWTKRLVIAADSDDSGAGLAAARTLAERASARCPVMILPAPAGQDWNDVLRGDDHG